MRVTSPPSSSMAMTGSVAAARSWRVSAASWARSVTFGPNSVTPARPSPRAAQIHSGARGPGNGGMRLRRLAGPELGRRQAPWSSLHRSGRQSAHQPSPDDQEEDHYRNRVHGGGGHDRAPFRAAAAEEELDVDRQRVVLVGLAQEGKRHDELVVGGDEGEDAGGHQAGRDQREQ